MGDHLKDVLDRSKHWLLFGAGWTLALLGCLALALPHAWYWE
jgi:hypothetical protein